MLYEYLGRCKALAFYDRDLAFATWDEPYFEGRTAKVSLENWLRRIGRRAREKGAGFGVLYVPTKLSAYWPILRPILDYDKLYCIRLDEQPVQPDHPLARIPSRRVAPQYRVVEDSA